MVSIHVYLSVREHLSASPKLFYDSKALDMLWLWCSDDLPSTISQLIEISSSQKGRTVPRLTIPWCHISSDLRRFTYEAVVGPKTTEREDIEGVGWRSIQQFWMLMESKISTYQTRRLHAWRLAWLSRRWINLNYWTNVACIKRDHNKTYLPCHWMSRGSNCLDRLPMAVACWRVNKHFFISHDLILLCNRIKVI